MTPEARAKRLLREGVRRVCDERGHTYYLQGQAGSMYGKVGLDYIGAVLPQGREVGVPFAVEVKRFDERRAPTPRQVSTAKEMRAAGIATFDVTSYVELEEFLEWMRNL